MTPPALLQALTRESTMRKNFFSAAAAFATVAFVTASAHATGTDIDTLFGGVDISSVKTNVLTIGAGIIGIHLAMKGIGLVKKAISKV